jgi:hypothetical protein
MDQASFERQSLLALQEALDLKRLLELATTRQMRQLA